jgi:prepilin peptidase CpaA
MNGSLYILLTIALTIAVIEDLRRQKIPNLVTFPAMVAAIGLHSLSTGVQGCLFAAGGLALGMGLFLIPYAMGGMGAGDVKLMGVAGAVFGPQGLIIASVLVVLAGGIYGFIIVALHPGYTAALLKRAWATIKTVVLTFQYAPLMPDPDNKLPVLKFAIPIALGAIGFMLMTMTGFDLFPELLGDNFKILSIVNSQGGTG